MSTTFSEKEEKILKTFEKTIPKMTELEREKLLSFGEGILFVKEKDGKEDKSAQGEDEKDEINDNLYLQLNYPFNNSYQNISHPLFQNSRWLCERNV